MDTVTQIALGTVIAEAFFLKRLGFFSVIFGGFCGWFPDIDVFFFHDWNELEYHRSLTHSLLFLPLITPIMGEIGLFWGKKGTRALWYWLCFWSLITHPLLDWNTSYGTKLFYPISNHRFALDSVGIIDLIYTIPLLYVLFFAYRKKADREKNRKRAVWALSFSTAFLGLGFWGTQRNIAQFHQRLQALNFTPIRTHCNPVPLFSPLRRLASVDSEGNVAIGLGHVLNSHMDINIHRNTASSQAKELLNTTEGDIFYRFAHQIIRIVETEERILFQASMYGLLVDPWNSPFTAEFIKNGEDSHLQLRRPGSNIDIGSELRIGMKKTFLWD